MTSQILISDIRSADKADLSVYHQDFPVVAVVDFAVERPAVNRQERLDFHSGVAELGDKLLTQVTGAQGVIQHPDLNPATGFNAKQGANRCPQPVVAKDICFQINIFLRFLHGL